MVISTECGIIITAIAVAVTTAAQAAIAVVDAAAAVAADAEADLIGKIARPDTPSPNQIKPI